MGVIFQKFRKKYDDGLLEAIEDYMNVEEIEDTSDIDIDDMIEYVRDNFIIYQEVVYFDEAWDYIGSGQRLENAIDWAKELGYNIEDLGSELLATLLKQNDLERQLKRIAEEI